MALVGQGEDEDGIDELSLGFDADVRVFQERCELVAGAVCFLNSCFDFSKSSIFCKYTAEVPELGHLLGLIDVDVEVALCSGDCKKQKPNFISQYQIVTRCYDSLSRKETAKSGC